MPAEGGEVEIPPGLEFPPGLPVGDDLAAAEGAEVEGGKEKAAPEPAQPPPQQRRRRAAAEQPSEGSPS